MVASDLIHQLTKLIEEHGDLIIQDSLGYPIEEISFEQSNIEELDNIFTIYSEGDMH